MSDTRVTASGDLTALLSAYDRVLRWERELGNLIWVRRSAGRIGRVVPVPRIRWSLRWLLVHHIRRTLEAIRAELDARTLNAEPTDTVDREAVDSYLRSLPALRLKRYLLAMLILGFGLAHLLAKEFGAAATSHQAARPLGDLTKAIVAVSPTRAVTGLGEFHNATAVAWAILVLGISFYAVLCVPATAFRLKRTLLNIGPENRDALSSATAARHVAESSGVYDLERAVEARMQLKRSIVEPPLDLVVSATLVVPMVWAGIALLVAEVFRHLHDPYAVAYFASLSAQVLLLPGGRLAWLARTANARRCGQRAGLPDGLRLPSRRRRLAAGTIDTLATLGLAAGIGFAIGHNGSPAAVITAILVAPTSAAALYAMLSLRGRASLGQRFCGLQIVDCDGTDATFGQTFARDVILSWGVFATLGWCVLWVPLIYNSLRSLWDGQRRTLCDVIAGTIVVQRQSEAVLNRVYLPVLRVRRFGAGPAFDVSVDPRSAVSAPTR